jgi:hypothetical protein
MDTRTIMECREVMTWVQLLSGVQYRHQDFL